MPINGAPAPLPRTAAGLHTALTDLLPNRAAEDRARLDADVMVRWIRAREVPSDGGRLNPGRQEYGPKPKPVSRKQPPCLFPAGTSKIFSTFAGVVARLPELIDALDAVNAPPPPAHRDKAAAPLYSAVWPESQGKPEYWFPSTPRWQSPNNVDAANGDVVITDLATGKMVGNVDKAAYFARGAEPVMWWPTVPPELAQFGRTLTTCPPEDLITGGFMALPAYVVTMAQLEERTNSYMQLFASLRTDGGADRNRIRTSIRKTAMEFRRWADLFDPIADLMAAELAQYLDNAEAALAALAPLQISGDDPMPNQLTTATPANVAALATQIRDSISSGHGGRIAVAPGAETAFSWSPGIAATLLRYLALGTATGRKTTVVIASDSGTSTGSVPEGGTKPNAVDFDSSEVDLKKYAGIASLSVESAQFVSNIEAAISVTMASRLLRGIEADTVVAILAAAGVSIAAAANITDGTLEAIAAIRGNGGTPTVVGLSSGDWLEIMKATGSQGFINFAPESGPAGTWLGLYPVILPTLTDGNAVVLDGTAVTVLETDGGPLAVVDPFTGLGTNQIRIALETWATSVVNAPGGVATVAVGP